jgi:GNAT superfamily N-acetyltransferase
MMHNNITVRPIHTKNEERAFIWFQWKVYKGNPYWVPPLITDRKKLIDKKSNPFYKHAEMQLFLAECDGKVVGRIGAIVNHNHNKEHHENIGFFGFLECINDQMVANALFDSAKGWLQTRDVTAIRGPASPSVNDEYGLLVDGFDKPPAVLMSYNPPYYQQLLESYGFKKARDLFAYEVQKDKVFSEKLVRLSEAVKKRQGLVIRTLNMKDFWNDVKKIHELYTKAWSKNWGEVPLTDEEFHYMAKDLRWIVDPDVVIIAELKGKPIGFGMSLPDINIVLKDNKRGYLIPGLLRLLVFKKRIDRVRIVILGVLPEYLNSGVGGLLFYETGRRGVAKGYPYGEASWVLEDNVMMNRGAELLGGEKTKTYRIYELPIN